MTAPADAIASPLLDRLPAAARPYASLARWDRPVGIWLLFLPCLIGQAVGRIGEGFGWIDLMLAALWLVGATAMRGAGCTLNDIIDRKIDAQVARTAGRPIPAGLVSVKQAAVWLAIQCGVGLGVLLCLPTGAQIVALLSVPLVGAYPFMKRITWWPQAWLGLTFNWGVLVGAVAVTGSLELEAWLAFAACIAWTIGYDTIYALQDIEDDALVGVRSTARLFGEETPGWLTLFYATFCGLLLASMVAAASPMLAVLAGLPLLGLAGWRLLRQIKGVEASLPPLGLFKDNVAVGWMVVGALVTVVLANWGLEVFWLTRMDGLTLGTVG
jgi:4-hydroxybenzoate polyprenyltransferase